MSQEYFINCSLNNKYEIKVQIEMRLSYNKHDDDDVKINK